MNKASFDKMVSDGIYEMIRTVLDTPEQKSRRKMLIENSSVGICGKDDVVLYVDNSYLPDGIYRPRVYKRQLSRSKFFAVLRTPVVDITVSNGETHEISFHPDQMKNMLPQDVDLEDVLAEVDRVSFSDKCFDKSRALLKSRASKPRTAPETFKIDHHSLGGTSVTIEQHNGRKFTLDAASVEIEALREMQSIPAVWGSTTTAFNVPFETTYHITVRGAK